jgi:hypothetical protein
MDIIINRRNARTTNYCIYMTAAVNDDKAMLIFSVAQAFDYLFS